MLATCSIVTPGGKVGLASAVTGVAAACTGAGATSAATSPAAGTGGAGAGSCGRVGVTATAGVRPDAGVPRSTVSVGVAGSPGASVTSEGSAIDAAIMSGDAGIGTGSALMVEIAAINGLTTISDGMAAGAGVSDGCAGVGAIAAAAGTAGAWGVAGASTGLGGGAAVALGFTGVGMVSVEMAGATTVGGSAAISDDSKDGPDLTSGLLGAAAKDGSGTAVCNAGRNDRISADPSCSDDAGGAGRAHGGSACPMLRPGEGCAGDGAARLSAIREPIAPPTIPLTNPLLAQT